MFQITIPGSQLVVFLSEDPDEKYPESDDDHPVVQATELVYQPSEKADHALEQADTSETCGEAAEEKRLIENGELESQKEGSDVSEHVAGLKIQEVSSLKDPVDSPQDTEDSPQDTDDSPKDTKDSPKDAEDSLKKADDSL